MITTFKLFKMNESISNFDLSNLVTIISIKKDVDGDWIYTTDTGKKFILKKDKVNILSKIDDKFANFVNTGHPITKYFETEADGETISYAANFAVDIIALNAGRVYLIDRKDGRGWALPGGFIDAGETPQEAAVRELQEETLAKIEDIKDIKPLPIVKANDPREINFYTYPFIMNIKNSAELKYADDAINSRWYLLGRASRSKLAFPHHNDILKQVSF